MFERRGIDTTNAHLRPRIGVILGLTTLFTSTAYHTGARRV